MNEDLFKNLITRFLDGKATPHEKEILSTWLRQDPKAEEMFYFLLSKRESDHPQYLPETESRVTAYVTFLNGGKRMTVNDQGEHSHTATAAFSYRLSIAASLLVIISSLLYFFSDSFLYKSYESPSGSIRMVTLDDGSTVTLNANSSVKVLRDFFSSVNREVWIEGEGFFDIRKSSNQPKLIVHTTNFDVEVLGTKFNVNDRRGKSEVILAEGRIKLTKKDQDPLIMNPGDRVSVSAAQDEFEQTVAESREYDAWRNSMLVFENTPLSEVTEIILDYYNVNVVVSDSLLAKRQFTGTLPNNDIDVILLALSTAYNIDIERDGERIILKSKASNQPHP